MLELGRKITNELDLKESVDTLGRWMAHYVAQLMNDAEHATTDERPAKMKACGDAICGLWQHRREYLHFVTDVQPILRALERLDPEPGRPRYWAGVAVDHGNDDETATWLELATVADEAAAMVIRHCLTQAGWRAAADATEWVDVAEQAGLDEDADIATIRVINRWKADQAENMAEIIQARIDRLESLAHLTTQLAQYWREKKTIAPNN